MVHGGRVRWSSSPQTSADHYPSFNIYRLGYRRRSLSCLQPLRCMLWSADGGAEGKDTRRASGLLTSSATPGRQIANCLGSSPPTMQPLSGLTRSARCCRVPAHTHTHTHLSIASPYTSSGMFGVFQSQIRLLV